MEEVVKCPNCKKRIFDLEWNGRTVVKIKCQHCRRPHFKIEYPQARHNRVAGKLRQGLGFALPRRVRGQSGLRHSD